MADRADIMLKQKEQKTLKFTFKNITTGAIIPLTGAIFKLVIENFEGTEVVTKNDGDFDKSQVINGIVRITLSENDLNQSFGVYELEIKTSFSEGEIDKSKTFTLNIIQSLIMN